MNKEKYIDICEEKSIAWNGLFFPYWSINIFLVKIPKEFFYGLSQSNYKIHM